MELALGALASFGAEAAVGTAAATAAEGAVLTSTLGAEATSLLAPSGGTLLSFLGSSPVLSVLSGAATAVSVLQQINAGNVKAEGLALQSQEARAEAVGEEAAGAKRSARLKQELLRTLGENDVAYAASGIDLGAGEAASSRGRTSKQAYDEIALDRETTNARVAGFRARELAYQRMSRQSRQGALLGALASAGEGAAKIGRRGYA